MCGRRRFSRVACTNEARWDREENEAHPILFSPKKELMAKRPGWTSVGTDPDYRFSLANERTFLAWIRTALSLVAGSILLEQFATKLQPRIAVVSLAAILALLAALLSVVAYRRWRDNEIAMRTARPLSTSFIIPLLSTGALLVSAAIASLFILR
jgi:putative membrane protein